MILTELTGIKKVIDINQWLKDNNWHEIGAGLFGKVYSNNSKPYVLKLYKTSDVSYTHFLNSIDQYNNIHVPKIGKARTIEIPEKINIVQIEKLNKIEYFSDTYDYCDFVPVLIDYYDIDNYNELLNKINSLDDETIEEIIFDYKLKYEININSLLKFVKKQKSLFEFVIQLFWQKPNNSTFDLHGGNFMQRKDGTIVVIDPYFGVSNKILKLNNRNKKVF